MSGPLILDHVAEMVVELTKDLQSNAHHHCAQKDRFFVKPGLL